MSYLMCMLCILGMRGEGGIELESLVAVVRIVFILNTKAPQRLVCSNYNVLKNLLLQLFDPFTCGVLSILKMLSSRLPQLLISFWDFNKYGVNVSLFYSMNNALANKNIIIPDRKAFKVKICINRVRPEYRDSLTSVN
jgi:hypothetical protein